MEESAKLEDDYLLNYLSYYDYLTGLTNEKYFYENLKKSIKTRSDSEKLVIIYVKIKNLDEIINILGFRNSNKFINDISQKIRKSCLEVEALSLYRGNKFFILCSSENAEMEDYKSLNEKLDIFLQDLKNYIIESGYSYMLKIKIGVSIYPDHAQSAEDILSKAHHAMHLLATEEDGYFIYNEDLFLEKLYNESLRKDLEKAIDNQEFQLEFQPKIDSYTENTVAFEALLRWTHPQKGRISPGKFIPMALESLFIKEIGIWVLKESFKLLKKWQNLMPNNDFKICMNISSVELNDTKIINKIENIADSFSVPNRFIEFEITERSFSEVPDKVISKLKEMDFKIILDDFGTGYSSLSYFGRLQADIVKLDKSFIDDIDQWRNKALVETVINLSHKFDVEVVGEGVETKEQLEILRDLNCDYIQGFYFYKPMPIEKIEKIFFKK